MSRDGQHIVITSYSIHYTKLYDCSNRLSLGKIRREENILWSFAPHDIAIIVIYIFVKGVFYVYSALVVTKAARTFKRRYDLQFALMGIFDLYKDLESGFEQSYNFV